MSFNMLAFQMESSFGALAAGAVFFLVFAVVAWVAFRILKKTVKMALRMTIVVIILLIAVTGSFSLWWFNSGTSTSSRPASSRPR